MNSLRPLDAVVSVARSARAEYGLLPQPVAAPELPSGNASTVALAALRELFRNWGLDREHAESPQWNPLGAFIAPGARVVLKPNWVLHWNKSGQGMDCLITHSSVMEAVLEYVALAHPGSVVLGDAPVQGCNFDVLRKVCALDEIVERFRRRGMDLRLADFRRTVLPGENYGRSKLEACRGMEQYVLFDLQEKSLLEPLRADSERFRVTMYNPELLHRTHAPQRHQYLIAREILEADVVLNLPKLKTHKKACVTGALKNLVGINGHKEYLPHHRKGGGGSGGDCYAGRSWLKGRAEDLLDIANRTQPGSFQVALARAAAVLIRGAVLLGSDNNLEGSWFGNDTVWRTSLDLQRIALYGRADGTIAERPARHLISITDAIIGGEGDGPMSPTPVPSRFLTGAVNPAAAEWVHCRLMGLDPQKIPLVREAFGSFPYPLAVFTPQAIRVRMGNEERSADEIVPFDGRAFAPPRGWQGHCELRTKDDHPTGEQALVA
ncbi:MAG: DUF362 domain-containing protein [Acidobacteria bacterium]|nr:DUF362 domain-containing protein [Acidobacteriota bacterium]MCL5289260.1 DUF362 domain-containing protein [Acidobacteriota bacterium]